MITAEIQRAIDQLNAGYPGSEITIREDGEGGAYVIVETVELPTKFVQPTTWFGFRITFQYPFSDVYPLFVRGDLSRVDGKSVVVQGLQQGFEFEGRAAIQISRRSNRLNPQTDTALLKMIKVLKWLEEET